MENLSRARQVRGAHRSVATKLENEARKILEKADVMSDAESARLEAITGLLANKRSELKEQDYHILGLVEANEVDTEVTTSHDIELRITEIITRIQRCFPSERRPRRQLPTPPRSQITPTRRLLPSPPIEQSQFSPISTVSSRGNGHSKLPKLNLPKFNGDVTSYFSFWEGFRDAIHTNPEIPPSMKFSYLKSYLDGPAARAIEGLPVTEGNYQSAVDILHDRFGKKQKIISKHMDELLRIPPCNNDKIGQLRFVYDKINIHVRGLKALGIDSGQYGSLLIPVILSRVPNEIALLIARHTQSDVWSISDVLEIIKNEVEAREMRDQLQTTEVKDPKPIKPRQGTTSSFHTKMELNPRQNCCYCDGNHSTVDCTKEQDVSAKRALLKKNWGCFVCLRKGHTARQCRKFKRCTHCHGKHHPTICTQEAKPPEQMETPSLTATSIGKKGANVLLQTAQAVVCNRDNGKRLRVRILLDNGSQRSYISEEVYKKLGLKSLGKHCLNLNTFGSGKIARKHCEVVSLALETSSGEVVNISGLTYPVICSPIPSKVDITEFSHLQGLQFADNALDGADDNIDILLGADQYFDIVIGDIIRGEQGPVAIKTKLGWVLSGSTGNPGGEGNVVSTNLCIDGNVPSITHGYDHSDIVDTLKLFWEVEHTGFELTKDLDESESFCDVQFTGNRYQVGLPWKPREPDGINSNFELCKKRLNSLYSRLVANKALLSEYNKIFQDQLAQGIVEKVPLSEISKDNVNFMPHHAVIREERTTSKVRVVFDASCKSQSDELSLNDRLERGPNCIPLLFDVMVRFRVHTVALIADIEKAFLQIEIRPEDRDYLRFLWLDDVSVDKPAVIQLRYARLPFGLRPSPSVLGSVIKAHLTSYEQSNPEVVKVLRQIFVDDLSTGANSVEHAFDIYQKSKEIMSAGSFNLRKWNSNSKELLCKIAREERQIGGLESRQSEATLTEDEQTYAKASIGLSSAEDQVKILGLRWDTDSDEFCFDLTEIVVLARTLPITKRTLLKLTAKIFDPLGVLSVFTVDMKIMFQELCLRGVQWDEELRGEDRLEFNLFLSKLKKLRNVRIPRCYFSQNDVVHYELHGFSDASEKAYACVVYMRTEYSNGFVDTRIVASKARVAPIKKPTIPKLELMGALLLAQLMNTIREVLVDELQTTTMERNYWVDSIATLCWIQNCRPWKQFVRHRVQQIRELSSKEAWGFCPGSLNPADLPSRGQYGKDLSKNTFWWKGPEFLQMPRKLWPNFVNNVSENEVALREQARETPNTIHTLATSVKRENLLNVVSIMRFRSKTMLLRTIAWCFRFIRNCKSRSSREGQQSLQLQVSEIETAERQLIRSIQTEAFSDEYSFLSGGKGDKDRKPPLLVSQLNLFLDENGIIRACSRIRNSSVSDSAKAPVLLPARNRYTELLIWEYHYRMLHSGIRDTLNAIRQKYWILKGRSVVKRVLRPCIVCKWVDGTAYKHAIAPSLPNSRVEDAPPFTSTGVDFAGPLLVKNNDDRKDALRKTYICLFTCFTTRAVHLELVEDLNVHTFLMAFRRFCARKGTPKLVISDNAKTFKAAAKEVREIINSEKIRSHLTNQGISWEFITPKSPWKGGTWERLVRSVKRSLHKVVGRSVLNSEELRTILVEIESVVNARPLTYVFDDVEGVSYPITPSQLLYGRNVMLTPNDSHLEVVSTQELLTKRAKHHRKLLADFSKRWKNEYLIGLREVANRNRLHENCRIKNGELVIIKDEQCKRSFWKMGRVIELIKSKDGIVRSVSVKVASGNGTAILKRPLQLLIPLEINVEDERVLTRTDKTELVAKCGDSLNTLKPIRSRRNAAVIGEIVRRDNP